MTALFKAGPVPLVPLPVETASSLAMCGRADFSRNDHEYYVEREKCHRQVDELQAAQRRYNKFIQSCAQIGHKKDDRANPRQATQDRRTKRTKVVHLLTLRLLSALERRW